MLHPKVFVCLLVLFVLACNSPVTRKIVIMGRGKIIAGDNKIEMKDGMGYAEEKLEIRGMAPEAFQVNTPWEKMTINIPEEKGVYILNLKKDTIIGSKQLLGVDISSGHTITQEELRIKIDSLTRLTKGDNVFFGGRNYFIIPGQLIKISSYLNAKIYGPYKLIPSIIEVEDNNTPEIYKFYTNTDMRGLIEKFRKMSY